MKYVRNEVGCFYLSEDILPSISRLCELIEKNPLILMPIRGLDNDMQKVCLEKGFHLYSTVKKTTLLYERESDCFFKMLHPLTLKERLLFLFINRAEDIYRLSEKLRAKGVRVVEVVAYGTLKKDRMPLYVMRRVDGESIYNILIKRRGHMGISLWEKVMGEIARLHRLGYWLGDAHLSHIFIDDSGVSGLIDVDSIRRNWPYMLKNLAKDIGALYHPALPLSDEEKKSVSDYYLKIFTIKDEVRFLKMIKHYMERRWKD